MNSTKLIVLIVDDNKKFVDRMIGILDDPGNLYNIRVATDYDEAHQQLLDEPDVVLLDISLPGKSGIEVLRTIYNANWDCKVIMLTNNTNEYYRQQCAGLGASYFLDKSVEFGRVPDIINRMNLGNRAVTCVN